MVRTHIWMSPVQFLFPFRVWSTLFGVVLGNLDWLPTKTGNDRKSNNRPTSKSLEYISLSYQSFFFAVKTPGSFIDSSQHNLRSLCLLWILKIISYYSTLDLRLGTHFCGIFRLDDKFYICCTWNIFDKSTKSPELDETLTLFRGTQQNCRNFIRNS